MMLISWYVVDGRYLRVRNATSSFLVHIYLADCGTWSINEPGTLEIADFLIGNGDKIL